MDHARAHNVLVLLAGKWTLSVLTALSSGPLRFNDLQRALSNGVNDRSLTSTLRRLEAHGLVERAIVDHQPPAVGYASTGLAAELLGSLRDLFDWVDRHGDELGGGPHTRDLRGHRR